MLRLSLARNSGKNAGVPVGVVLIEPTAEALRRAAAAKLRLKGKEVAAMRVFALRSGEELPLHGPVAGTVGNGEVVVISGGEPFFKRCAGPEPREPSTPVGLLPPPEARATPPLAKGGEKATPLPPGVAAWHVHSAAFHRVEWATAAEMNEALGRLATMHEHAVHAGTLVPVAVQHQLPSQRYEGHNLYAHVFESALAVEHLLTAPEAAFIATWRLMAAPRVVIAHVVGARDALRHELFHVAFALLPTFRQEAEDIWDEWRPRLAKWMRDLGYHDSRHADEFAAYILTEAPGFWRGRVTAEDIRAVRGRFQARGLPLDGAQLLAMPKVDS